MGTGQKVRSLMKRMFGFALICWLTLSQVATKHFLIKTGDTSNENVDDYELNTEADKAAALEAFDESGKNSEDYIFKSLLGKGARYVGKKLGRWIGKKIKGNSDEE